MSRYHKAAIDGYLDLLKEATRKDLNAEDEDGMTPTLWAAFHGHIDALQLICSRGGDPNKSDIWGNTPLHHAANNGHMHIISFLVNFGANLFALDNEFHTAMDVAAGRDRMDCVRFLDNAASQQTTKNAKKVDTLKKEAQKQAKKHVKHCEEIKKKHQNKMDKMYRNTANDGSASDSGVSSSFSSTGTMRSVNEQFSKLISSNPSGSLKATLKGTLQSKFGKKDKGTLSNAGGGNGNVIFLTNENGAPRKPELTDVFTEQDENGGDDEGIRGHAGYNGDDDDDDDYNDSDDASQNKQSIFNRPGLGGLIFMNATMGAESEDIPSGNNESLGFLVQSDMLEMEGDNDYEDDDDAELPWKQEELGLDDGDDEETSPLDVFLSSISLPEFSLAFTREQLDLEALMLCSDDDLKGIRIQLGPRKKILDAVTRRKNALQNPGVMKDCFL